MNYKTLIKTAKQLLVLVAVSISFFSCKNDSKEEKLFLPRSGGSLNTLTIVTGNQEWAGEIGDATREVFAAPVYGLPVDEPMFTLKQIQPKAFHELIKKSRTFVEFKKGLPKEINYVHDVYATPQLGIVISGQNNTEILAVLKDHAEEMIQKVKKTEMTHKTSDMENNQFQENDVSETFGIDLTLLYSYRVAKKTKDFIWLRKDIRNGDLNLMIYNLPNQTIKSDSTAITSIVKLRDSIGKAHILGRPEGSYMITEKAFTPYLGSTTINNKPTLETRGMWDVKNDFMAGPFINYIIDDKDNNRQLVLEGFTYAPQVSKRDYMFELEAIIRSVELH